MVLFEILTIIIGIIYGYVSPRRENRGALLRVGLIIGIVLAIIFVVLGLLVSPGLLVLGALTAPGLFLEVVILTVLFIVGMYIGNWQKSKVEIKVTQKLPSKNKQVLRKCPYCGAEVLEDDRFCGECGKPLRS